MRKIHLFLTVVIAVIVIWNLYQQSTRQIAAIPATPASVATTQNMAGVSTTTKVGPSSLYPDPTLTPGAVFPVDAATVCKSGYATSVRDVPASEKQQVYQEYGIPYPKIAGSYEADHFISLELGGNNDIKNLWPEPANPTPGFHEKDVVENYLHDQVCSGAMSLAEAQREISTDWYAVYLKVK